MSVKDVIYATLQSRYGESTEVSVEALAEHRCTHRHIHTLMGSPRNKPLTGEVLLLREMEGAYRSVISTYLFGAFGKRYRHPSHSVEGAVTIRSDGQLDDMLVEVAIVPSVRFGPATPAREPLVTAITKATLLGFESVLLITVDRNTQDWAFFLVKDFADFGQQVLKDVRYLNALFSGVGIKAPMASELTCNRCPFQDTCEVEAKSDPMPYDPKASVQISSLRQVVDAYLLGQNQHPKVRQTHVIHPSAISTKPCDRAIAYGLLGVEERETIEPKLRRIFDFGHAVHDTLQRLLLKSYADFKAEVKVTKRELRIHGHCDGAWSPRQGAEIKSISAKGFESLTKPKPEHEIQAVIYAVLLELDTIHYIYVNKDTGELLVYDVPPNRDVWHKVATRATNIIKTVEQGELPPQIDKDYICRECSYAWHCKPDLRPVAPRESRRFGR